MKTKNVNRNEVRSEFIMLKISADEKKAIKKCANEMGLTMSAFVRMATSTFMTSAMGVKK